MELLEGIRQAVAIIKGLKENPIIEGQHPRLTHWVKLYNGNPDNRTINVQYPDGTVQRENLKSFNLPQQLANAWANNYANENLELYYDDEKSNDRLQEILEYNHFKGKFGTFTSMFMGLGLGAITVTVSEFMERGVSSNAEVKLDFVDAQRVYPITVDNGIITECAFVRYSTNGATIVLHLLDENKKYIIAEVNGTSQNKGNYIFDYEHITMLFTNQSDRLFTTWSPVKAVNNEETLFGGVSIFDQCEDVFLQCDVCYDALYKEIKLGKKVKFISEELEVIEIDNNGKKKHDIPHTEDESVFYIPTGSNGHNFVQEINGELRTGALIQALNTHMNLAAMLCGLGQTAFEFDSSSGRPIQTATGVIAKQSELYRNVIKQENNATEQFKVLLKAIKYFNNNFTNKPKINDNVEINVKYDDNIIEDTQSQKQQALNEINAGVQTIVEYRVEWYGESEEEAKSYVANNGLLLDKYLPAYQSGALSEEMFVDLVFGADNPKRTEYINSLKAKKTQEMNLDLDE